MLISVIPFAQQDSIFASVSDSITNQDQIFNRPFVTGSGSKVSIGGYAEANTNYINTDGVSEGFSMEMRRSKM